MKKERTRSKDGISISAIIPSCNRPVAVRDAVASALHQTTRPVEIIVVDNGEIRVRGDSLPDEVTLLKLESYVGVSRARNEGAKVARGNYVAFLDDDDTWVPSYLETMCEAILEEGYPDLLIGRKTWVEEGREKRDRIKSVDNLMPALLYENTGVGGPNVIAWRDTFLEIGGYDERLRNAEDRALAIDFFAREKTVAYVPEAVVIIDTGQASRLSHRIGQLEDRRHFFSKYEHMMGWDVWLRAKKALTRFEVRESHTRTAETWARLKHFVLRLMHAAMKAL